HTCERSEGSGLRPRRRSRDIQAVHRKNRRPGHAGWNAVANPVQLCSQDEQLTGDRKLSGALYRIEANARYDQQTVRALPADHARRYPGDGSSVFRSEQPHDRDSHVDKRSEEPMRRALAPLVLLVLLSTSVAAPPKPASVLLPGTSPLVTFRILFTTGSAFD